MRRPQGVTLVNPRTCSEFDGLDGPAGFEIAGELVRTSEGLDRSRGTPNAVVRQLWAAERVNPPRCSPFTLISTPLPACCLSVSRIAALG